MKHLLSYLKQYPFQSVMAPLFKCLEACFELLIPLVMARMIDVGIGNADYAYMLRSGGILLLLALIGLFCSITAQYFAATVAARTGTALRADLFAHITGLGYAEIDRLGASTLLTRMTSDINQVQTGVNMFLRLFMRSPFIVFGAVIMAFTVNVKGALIFAVTVPLLSLVVFGILLGTMPLYRKVQNRLDKVMLSTRESLLGVRVVRAFNRESSEKAHFRKENEALSSLQIFVGKISALMNPLTVVIVNLAIVLLLDMSGKQVEAGSLSQGETVALVNYMSQILTELVKLANLIILMSKAMAGMKRVDSVFAVQAGMQDGSLPFETEGAKRTADDIDFGTDSAKSAEDGVDFGTDSAKSAEDGVDFGTDREQSTAGGSNAAEKEAGFPKEQDAATPMVEFRDVSFAYQGAKGESLSHISFRAMPGETIGIIGGTGSGKTTLVNLIPRFYDATEGEVLVKGKPVQGYRLQSLREAIGVVPQKAVLFAGSLRDNMRFGKNDASDEEINRALFVAQAKEIVDAKKKGLELSIEQGGKNLSGGQRQRFTIARALLREPKILILDDSASALDFATDAALRKAIRENTEDMTVFLISQRASSVKYSDRIIVLDDGRMEGIGSHKELLKTCPLYREICESQMTAEEVARDEA